MCHLRVPMTVHSCPCFVIVCVSVCARHFSFSTLRRLYGLWRIPLVERELRPGAKKWQRSNPTQPRSPCVIRSAFRRAATQQRQHAMQCCIEARVAASMYTTLVGRLVISLSNNETSTCMLDKRNKNYPTLIPAATLAAALI